MNETPLYGKVVIIGACAFVLYLIVDMIRLEFKFRKLMKKWDEMIERQRKRNQEG